jgi:hypothetical protein
VDPDAVEDYRDFSISYAPTRAHDIDIPARPAKGERRLPDAPIERHRQVLDDEDRAPWTFVVGQLAIPALRV